VGTVVSVESLDPRATVGTVVSVESLDPRATVGTVVSVESLDPRATLAGWTRKQPHLCNASPPGQPRAILAGDAKSPQPSPPELSSTVASETGASSPPAAAPGTLSLSTTAPTSQMKRTAIETKRFVSATTFHPGGNPTILY